MSAGDLSELSEDRLAAEREVRALAVLVHRTGSVLAARALAGLASDDQDAFRWLWALTGHGTSETAAFNAFEAFPPGVRPPEELVPEMRALLSRALPAGQQLREMPAWGKAQRALLRALDRQWETTFDVAEEIAAHEGVLITGLRADAIAVLASSADEVRRRVALERISALTPPEQLEVLMQLPAPYSPIEVNAVRSAVLEHLSRPNIDNAKVAQLAARLPVEELADVFAQPQMLNADRWRTLLNASLPAYLGRQKVLDLLERGIDDRVRRDAIALAVQLLPGEDAVAVGVWAHERFDDDWTRPLREHFAKQLAVVRHGRTNEAELRTSLVDALRQFASAGDSLAAAATLADVVRPGELDTGFPYDDPTTARRAGLVVGRITMRDDAQAFTAELTAMVERAQAAGHVSVFIEGMLASGSVSAIPDEIVRRGMEDPAASATLIRGNAGDRLVAAAAAEGSTAAAVIALTGSMDLLEAGQLESLLQQVTWRSVSEDDYRSVLAALAKRPESLAAEVVRAVDSAFGPEREAISNALLVDTIHQLVAAQAADHVEPQVRRAQLARLFHHPSDSVVAAAARWATALPADADLVQVVIRADDETGGQVPHLLALRRKLAGDLIGVAENPGGQPRRRAEALELAIRLAGDVARPAAFRLATSAVREMREVASSVLAETPGDAADVTSIQALLAIERVDSVRANLERALYRLTSSSIGEGIRNLCEVTGLHVGTTNLDPAVLIPDKTRHQAFIHWVDLLRARYALGGEPGPFLEAAINLADLMVDLVVVALFDATRAAPGLKPEQVEMIRHQAIKKPDTGSLIRQQQMIQRFNWFSAVATLREKRTAHYAPLGTTQPVKLTAEDVIVARSLLRDIVAGWMSSSFELHALGGQTQ